MSRTLLVEIGCEEIPARMIRAAAADLASRIESILDQAGLSHGATTPWGGSRRLAVIVGEVEERQADREAQVLGPPAKAAFAPDGSLTPAAVGFARKQGAEPTELKRVATDKGEYVGFVRRVAGRSVGEILADSLSGAVAGMSFPKTMRWGDAKQRWVRPVHWIVALHGSDVLDVEVLGVRSGSTSAGHRFLSGGPMRIPDADRYAEALREGHVIADPDERRRRIADELRRAAHDAGGSLVDDPELLEETVDLVEWPGVVVGRVDEAFLALPREVLTTTLRHHQKCFSVQKDGALLPVFLAVANTERDPSGHVRRGNEWVVGGRLADAQFFWTEDRKATLASRSDRLRTVTFHAKCGSYAEKASRMETLARKLAEAVGGLPDPGACARGARLAKNDLTTGLVGEFPELQGIVGGLLLRHEGEPEAVWRGVYEQYLPAGAEGAIPSSVEGCVVSVADRLDSIARLVEAGEAPSGSRDPFGLRRAANAVFRVVEERAWPLSLGALASVSEGGAQTAAFLRERYALYLRDRGFTTNEVLAVLKPRVSEDECLRWHMHDVLARLEAIRPLRGRTDFEHLVDLTKRVDNILTKGADEIRAAETAGPWSETEPAARALEELADACEPLLRHSAESRDYRQAVDVISRFIAPVERFFAEVLVLDPKNPAATRHRTRLLAERLKPLLTSTFDIRELAGQAERKA